MLKRFNYFLITVTYIIYASRNFMFRHVIRDEQDSRLFGNNNFVYYLVLYNLFTLIQEIFRLD